MRDEKGFHVLPLVLAIVVIGVIVFVGRQVLQKQKQATPSSQAVTPAEEQLNHENYAGDITAQLQPQQVQLSGAGTQGLDVDLETGLVYAAHNGSVISKCDPSGVQQKPGRDSISVIDPAKATEIAREAAGGAPIWPTVDPKRNVVYVSNSGTSSITIHEKGTGKKVDSISVGGLPHAFGLLDKHLAVSNTFDQSQTYYSLVDVETKKVIANQKVPKFPHPVVVDPDTKLAYMMGVEAAEVAVIDMTTGAVKETFKLEGGGGQMVMSKRLGKIVTDSSKPGTSAAIFDYKNHQLLGTLGFEGANAPGTGLAIDEASGLFFVVIGDQNALGVASLKTLKPLAFFKTGSCPYGVKLDTKRGKGYVTNSGDSTLTIFDLKGVKAAL